MLLLMMLQHLNAQIQVIKMVVYNLIMDKHVNGLLNVHLLLLINHVLHIHQSMLVFVLKQLILHAHGMQIHVLLLLHQQQLVKKV